MARKKALMERAFPKLFTMGKETYFVTRGGITTGFTSKAKAMVYLKKKGGILKKR